MESLEEKIQGFKAWLVNRGRATDTADGYANDVKATYRHPQAPLGRLRDKTLAPKTLRRSVASLRAWCKFTKDSALLEQISDIRLPPPMRKVAKVPLTREEWDELVEEIDKAHYVSPYERACLGIMAVRGIRVGDVLRMKRVDLANAKASGVLSYEAKTGKRIELSIKPIAEYIDILLKEEGWECVRDLISSRSQIPGAKQDSASQQLSRALKKVGEKIGIRGKELYPHRLRRTYASHFLVAAGNDLEKLRQHMSWSNIGTASGYADHSRAAELDEIADKMMKKKNLKGD